VAIIAARERDVRALLATLLMSHGIPLIQQGDEMGRTQKGNNNAYAQDNEITWLDWDAADGDLVDYVAAVNRFRRAHPALTADKFLSGQGRHGMRDVIWLHPDNREMNDGDWSDAGASVLGMLLTVPEDRVLVWFNRHVETVNATLPSGPWAIGLVSDHTAEAPIVDRKIALPARSVVVLVPDTEMPQQASTVAPPQS
jgi:glycogen operon protein